MNFASMVPVLIASAPVVVFGAVLLALALRRAELRRFEKSHQSRSEAIARGSHKARLLHPDIDLSRCIGCGACVRACPEDGVLDLLHGQAVVVHGARCVGHGRCADACPTAAIALTFGDLSTRDDLPAISEEFEAVGVPGLYIAGELSGFALVRTAVSHGTTVANAVARTLKGVPPTPPAPDATDLLIVGLGPAGLACALRAKELGVRYLVIEQAERVGGTVAAYPRKKMVMTQPVQLPLFGKLPRLEYLKEELIELWTSLIDRHQLSIRTGLKLASVSRGADGWFTAQTSEGPIRARAVCLALGRRGTPRKLGVPGEHLSKVGYALLDAESYRDAKMLVVGGGDSAVEAAMALGEQPGNVVTLSYRGDHFGRIKSRNETRLKRMVDAGRVTLELRTQVARIAEDEVVLRREGGEDLTLPNDEVFIFAGGEPPFDLLKKAGVSFDPARRPAPTAVADQSGPLLWAFGLLLAAAATGAGWTLWQRAYYGASHAARTFVRGHDWLRPGGRLGLGLGLLAVALFVWNLAYLVRRRPGVGDRIPGSLRFWMGSHVFTGLASLGCVALHAGWQLRNTVGGFALLALGIVLGSGIVGRYFYAIVPHAANGREMHLDELRAKLATLSTAWDRSSRGLGQAVRERVDEMVDRQRWNRTFVGRVLGMFGSHLHMRRLVRELRHDEAFHRAPPAEREELLQLARRAFRLTLQIAHFEEIRGVLSAWRFVHRWLALLMVLFVLAHIVTAVRYARLEWPFSTPPLEVAP